MYCLWSLPLTTFITSIPLSLLFCFVFVICVFLWPFTELWRVHFIMIISTRHVFPGPGTSCRDLLSDLFYEMDQCLQVKRQNLALLGWQLQMGGFSDHWKSLYLCIIIYFTLSFEPACSWSVCHLLGFACHPACLWLWCHLERRRSTHTWPAGCLFGLPHLLSAPC